MKAIRYLNVFDDLLESGNIISQFSIHDRAGMIISKTRTDNLGTDLVNIAIHRGDLHRILLADLDKKDVINGKRVKDLENGADSQTLILDDQTRLSSQYLIAAD